MSERPRFRVATYYGFLQVYDVSTIALTASLGIAAASWYVVERPSLRLAHRLTGPTAQTRTLADDRAAVAAGARPS
jgi:peptidoglycan/LPS O-acetylase OafA/YrhL